MDPLSGLALIGRGALKHWRLFAGLAVLASAAIYIAVLQGRVSEARSERNAILAVQNQTVGSVRTVLLGLGVKRTVTAKSVADEFSWLAGEYSKLDAALIVQNAAIAAARSDAEAVRRELDRARTDATKVRRDRDRLADQIRSGSGGLTPEEWSQL